MGYSKRELSEEARPLPAGTGLSRGIVPGAALLLMTVGLAKAAPPRADPLDDPLPEGAVARLGSSRLRVGNSAFALTPDGRAIVAVSVDLHLGGNLR